MVKDDVAFFCRQCCLELGIKHFDDYLKIYIDGLHKVLE